VVRSDSNTSNESKPVTLNLFCGAGGMSLGFQIAGYHIGLGVDNDPLACQAHAHNFGGRCVLEDISIITDPRACIQEHSLEWVDVIIGGPPCQGFSRVGRGKLREVRNDSTYIHDPRNQYYKEFVRFVEALQPLYFVSAKMPTVTSTPAEKESRSRTEPSQCARRPGCRVIA
jgi:DNA (cytosine-5)-methyltransferase 1